MKAKKITDAERKVIETTATRHRKALRLSEDVKVAYSENGNFTTAVIFLEAGKVLSGAAKRNPSDELNPIAGRNRALSRAVAGPIVSY